MLTDHCSGSFLNEIKRAALLTVVLGISVVLATGCASTNRGVSVKLMSSVTSKHLVEQSNLYELARSPEFSDFFGS